MLNPTQSIPQSVSTGANAAYTAMPRPSVFDAANFQKTLKPKNGNGLLSLFLNDKWAVRKTMALGNEIAESAKEAMHNLFPKPVTTFVYRLLWSLAFVCTGFRVAANVQYADKEDKFKSGMKMFIHDIIAAISVPAVVANIANGAQNWVYNMLRLPSSIKDALRTAGSLAACNFTIDRLDGPARDFAAWFMKIDNDQHKTVNAKAKAEKAQKLHAQTHNPSVATAA